MDSDGKKQRKYAGCVLCPYFHRLKFLNRTPFFVDYQAAAYRKRLNASR
jgi:hypothetical protein